MKKGLAKRTSLKEWVVCFIKCYDKKSKICKSCDWIDFCADVVEKGFFFKEKSRQGREKYIS